MSEASGARPPEGQDEIAWLIEGIGNGQPVWWTGRLSDRGSDFMFGPLHTAIRMPKSTQDMEPEFSPDHAKALRFARQQDAECAIGMLPRFYQSVVHASEHMWMGSGARPEGPWEVNQYITGWCVQNWSTENSRSIWMDNRSGEAEALAVRDALNRVAREGE